MWEHLFPILPMFLYDTDEGGSGSGKKKKKDKSEPTDENNGSGDDDGNEDDEDGKKKKTPTEELRDENNRLKREAAERDRKDREAEQERLREAGEHEERADRAEARVAELEQEIADRDQRDLIEKSAAAVGMEFPQDAAALLTADEKKDESTVEAGLRRLKQERPKLFGEVRRSGGSIESDAQDREEERKRINDAQNGASVGAGIQRLRGVQRKT